MKVAVIYNKQQDVEGVINVFGMQNRETYNPKTVERVASSLEKGGHNVRIVDGNIKVIDQLESFMPRVVQGEQPGMVFNMAYGIQGVSRYTHLPAMLEMLGVPYVGSSPQAHALALDKVIAKILFDSHGISTPRFWNFASADDSFDDVIFPVVVKPKMEAASWDSWELLESDEWSLMKEVNVLFFGHHAYFMIKSFISIARSSHYYDYSIRNAYY